MSKKRKAKPPEISPYLFPAILAIFGLWCFYDGFFSTDLDMQEHLLFNRVAAGVLLPWSVIDFIRTRKREAKYALEKKEVEENTQEDSTSQ